MGAIQSIPQDSEPDPWWPNRGNQQEQCNQQSVAIQDVAPEVRDQGDESWLKLQELGKTIQRLTDEHMSLTNANKETEKQQKGELNDLRAQYLKQELGMKKLEEDTTEHQKLITYLKDKLEITEKERNRAFDENKELKSLIKELQHEHKNDQEDNKRLQEQLVMEKKEQEQLLFENKRLEALLEIKQNNPQERAEGTEDSTNANLQEADSSNSSKRTLTPSPKATAELEKFREEMKTKREARHQALQAISNEMERLRGELNAERVAKCEAIEELERMKEEGVQDHVRTQLEDSITQLNKKIEECQQLESDKEKYQTQIATLKEVITISKQMLGVRENQVDQLKKSLREIEGTVMGGKHNGPITEELKAEYESQMENIKSLKALYSQRMKVMEDEKEKLLKEQERLTEELEFQTKRSADCEERIKELEEMISERNQTVSDLQDQLSDSLDQSRNLSNELALINNIFTQMLVGSDADLDKLIKVLQENHDLMTEITTSEDCEETAASLPRLLLNLINQVNTPGKDNSETQTEATGTTVSEDEDKVNVQTSNNLCKTTEENGLNLDAHDIALKLPKVWKVLLELIRQQVVPTATEDSKDSCYKTIDTPVGPRLVISVSKTFIRLKDLILEKKSLQKELGNLKQLNGHLESKLVQQEKRLSLVSTELRKTWSVVGRMHTQYQQLHTHEKVLRYELQQKRKMLNELKEELEYCREKWVEARKKNSQSEAEWRKLRKEFSSRKKEAEDTFNNSGESGYSDDRGDDSGEDDTSQSASPILDTETKETELDNFDVDVAVNSHEILSETENTEESSISSQNSSLPDLVSIAAENNTLPIPHELFQTQTEEQTIEECPTISLVISLKQQLACFTQDLEKITSNLDLQENIKAVKSIFSLPAIQVPEHLLHSKIVHTRPECKSSEKVLETCAARLKGVEGQYQQLFEKNTTSHRSLASSDRFEELQGQTGTTSYVPQPPPLPPPPVPTRSAEEILQARAARLKRLEEQCQQLFNKVTRTTERSTTLSNQLDELHQHYGPHDVASPPRTSSSPRFEDTPRTSSLSNKPSSSQRLEDSSSTPTEHADADSLLSDIPVPPPFPQRLPAFRLPTSLECSSEASTESHENENT